MMSTVDIVMMVVVMVGVAALWRYLLGNVRDNRTNVNQLRKKHCRDMEDVEQKIDETETKMDDRMEEIKDIIERSSIMGQDERDQLTRIDENVSNLGDRMGKIESTIGNMTQLKFKDDKKGE